MNWTILNLDDYKQYPPTNSCYLDGRYFNMVFDTYPGLIREPLYIHIDERNNDIITGAVMKNVIPNVNYLGLLRVVIVTPTSKHSNLLIIDYRSGIAYWFDPVYHRLDRTVKQVATEYLSLYMNVRLVDASVEMPDIRNPNCNRSGFCLAYVIKCAYDTLLNRNFDGSDIDRFASIIEDLYGPLDPNFADIEYGWLDAPANRNLLIGGLGGATIGALLGGGTGALIGGGLGALGGYALTPK